MRNPDEYTYTAEWSDEDRAFTGTCLEFPGYSRTAPASHLALQETRDAVRAVLESLPENWPQNWPQNLPQNLPEGVPAGPGPAWPPGEADRQLFLPVRERKLSDAVLSAAAQAGRISPTGAPENREWLIIGRRANIIFFDAGNGWSSISKLEMKGCFTQDEFWQDLDRLDVRARNNGHNNLPDQAQAYRDEYPGDLVPLQERMFPNAAVWIASLGRIEAWHGSSKCFRKTQGERADIIHFASSGRWDWVRIESVQPHPRHTAQEFWDRLQEVLRK